MIFVIEDEQHAEIHGEYSTEKKAWSELESLSEISWDVVPNKPPCGGWKKCRRIWELIQYNDEIVPWKELNRKEILEISSQGVTWLTFKE